MIHAKNFIGGAWVEAEAKANINPSNTGETVGMFAQGDRRAAEHARTQRRAAHGVALVCRRTAAVWGLPSSPLAHPPHPFPPPPRWSCCWTWTFW